MVNYTAQLAEYTSSLKFEQLPSEVVEKAKQCLLDLLGIMVRARHDADSTPSVNRAVEALCPYEGPSTVVGMDRGYPPQYAALLNGTYGHSLDFDDTHVPASLHPGAPVIPVILALGEEQGIDGRRVVTAMVAGYEVICRVSMAANPKGLYDRGFHPTVVAGVFGATAAGAQVLGMDAAALESAFGINNSQAAGSMQFLANGSWNKRIHVGFAAHNAIVSLSMAGAGVRGSAYPVEGLYGFINGYGQGGDPKKLVEGLGESYQIMATGLKPYPSCRFTHGALDLIIDMSKKEKLHPDDVDNITIGLSSKAIDLVGDPQEQKRRPENVVDGQFSMHFTAAAAVKRHQFGWNDYELLGDPDVKDLMQRIEVVLDDEAEARYPEFFSRVVIKTRDGRTISGETDLMKGEPGNPMTWEELEFKFHELASVNMDQAARQQVLDLIHNLENVSDIRQLMQLFRSA